MTGGMICSDAFLKKSFSLFYFSVFYESYVGRDKPLYNHNNDDGGAEECSATPSVEPSRAIRQLAGHMSDIVLLVR